MLPADAVPPIVGAVVAGIVVVLTGPGGGPAPAPTPSVPEEMAGYSHVTGSVSSSPPGPVVAMWQHGYGVELFDLPQAVVLGAGGDTYRRVDVAEERAGSETQGDPAPMLLSPDGTRVAVGDHDTERPDVVVVELTTGGTTSYELPAGRSVVPLAWSADGDGLASLVSDEATSPYSGGRITGDVALLDLPEDSAEVLELDGSATAAAFSPDGAALAIEQSGGVTVVDLQNGGSRSLEVDGVLAGPAAWSPDGRLLAVTSVEPSIAPAGLDAPGTPTGLTFVDPSGQGRAVPDPVRLPLTGPGRVLGWAGSGEVLAVLAVDGTDAQVLSGVPLDGSRPRALMRMDDLGSYGVGRFQLASSVAGSLEVVDPDGVDRGPWPWALRGVLAVAAGLLAWYVARVAVRRRRS
ncbi:WD40 repeat domain-containing protein [Nocardioides sp. GCM10028917]|uniref:WD40 repeat domain-containing protein n=1 Tax=Nocardioides sp. GCM10028917 TaxID=3273408 RepID=UPI00361FBA50